MMNILLLLIILIIIFITNYKKRELFANYKKVVVKVSPHVKSPYTILINSDIKNIFQYLQSKIPLQYDIVTSNYNTLKSLNNRNIGLINDLMIYEFINKGGIIENNPLKKAIRFVCSFGYQYFYILVRANSNIYNIMELKNKTIGVYGDIDDNNYFFKLLGYGDNIKYKKYTNDSTDISTELSDGEIDAVFFIANYPTNLLLQFKDYRIIDMKNNNIENPTISIENKDFGDYGLVGSYKIINILRTKGSLYCLNGISDDYIYTFIKTIFSNIKNINGLHTIKSGGYLPDLKGLYSKNFGELVTINQTDTYKNKIPRIFIPSDLLPSEYTISLIDGVVYNNIHNGVKRYLNEVGYISDNPNPKCMHFAGAGKCPLSHDDKY